MRAVQTVSRILGSRPLETAVLEPRDPSFKDPTRIPHDQLKAALARVGVDGLYCHQAESFDLASTGHDVMVVTGTSSGKSLCYNLPVVDTCLREPAARALYLFPTKALAQDQAGKLESLLPTGLMCGNYDGDTPHSARASIRRSAHIVLTNPDMLHVGILPNQENWHRFFKTLRFVVLDEAHVYRGVFGSHVGGVIRRLMRLCEWHNNRPQVIACSATIANPAELFEKLTGRMATVVDNDTAPRGHRTVILVEPPEGVDDYSPNRDIAELLAEFVTNHVKTLAFCRARVTTELVVMQAKRALEKAGQDSTFVDSYRGGYTPKERRAIEKALFQGGLRGLATTNAMELGVDVGGLDAVLLNGYPGSVSSFWQQVGRAGRGTRDGLAVMLAHDDPLERFLVRSPELLLDKPVESATLNPDNPHVLEAQLRCAAYERPVGEDELPRFGDRARDVADDMVASGDAVWSAGRLFYPSHENPAASINIRGIEGTTILLLVEGAALGEMEEWRAYRQAHQGAVYLHRGVTYVVQELDLERKLALLVQDKPNYFTQAIVQSVVESTVEVERADGLLLTGVKVTTSIPGYVKRRLDGDGILGQDSLDLPVKSFDTVGLRLDLSGLSFDHVGTVHALEHALSAVAPMIAGCDRDDLGSCWYVMCPETMLPAVYVFDGTPGGIGLAEKLFEERRNWFRHALALLESCPCNDGCPACLLSPRCESGNEPLDKKGAVTWLSGHGQPEQRATST